MRDLKYALYIDIVMTLFMVFSFWAIAGLDAVVNLLPMMLIFGIAIGPVIMVISWVNAAFWQW